MANKRTLVDLQRFHKSRGSPEKITVQNIEDKKKKSLKTKKGMMALCGYDSNADWAIWCVQDKLQQPKYTHYPNFY